MFVASNYSYDGPVFSIIFQGTEGRVYRECISATTSISSEDDDKTVSVLDISLWGPLAFCGDRAAALPGDLQVKCLAARPRC